MISFLRPFVFPLALGLVLALVAAELTGWLKTIRFLRKFGQLEVARRVLWRRLQAFAFAVGFIALGAAAAAGPYFSGDIPVKALRAIVVLDVSCSMGATDYAPSLESRLDRAKDALSQLFRRYPEGSEVGLVIFAGEAFPWVAKLRDMLAVDWIVKHWVLLCQAPRQGSVLASGLKAALTINEKVYHNDAVVVLVSDGTDETAAPGDILAEYRRAKVNVIAVGVGRPDTLTSITLRQKSGEDKVFQTRLNETPLKEIAAATGGVYTRLVTGREIGDVFSEHTGFLRIVTATAVTRDLYQWPAGAAVALLALWFIRIRVN